MPSSNQVTNEHLQDLKEWVETHYAKKEEVYTKSETDTSFLKHGESTTPIAHDHEIATVRKDGFMSLEDKKKLDNIEDGAHNYKHPETHPAAMIEEDDDHRFVTKKQISMIENRYKIEEITNEEYNSKLLYNDNEIDPTTLYILTGRVDGKDAVVGIYFGTRPYLGGYLPRYIPVERVVLDKTRFNIEAGFETWIGASVYPSDSSFRTLDYEVHNKNIVEINEFGKIKGLNQGHTLVTIRAHDNPNIYAVISIVVSNTIADNVEINTPDGIDLTVGSSFDINYNVLPANTNNKEIYWTTSNRNIAIVDFNGVITGLSPGNCLITGYTTDGSQITDTLNVNIIKETIYSEKLIIKNLNTNLELGVVCNISYEILPENVTNKGIILTSSNQDVLEIDPLDHSMYAKTIGESILNIKTGDGIIDYGNIKITVKEPEIKVNKIEIEEFDKNKNVGDIFTISYNIFPLNANNYDILIDIRNSSNQLETVDGKNDTFIALNPGKSTIIIKAINRTDGSTIIAEKEIEITKKADLIPARGLILDSYNMTINKDEYNKTKISYTVFPANTTNKQVYWRSSNEKVISVDNEGNITANNFGSAIVTCYLIYSKISVNCNIRVTGNNVPVSTVELLMDNKYKRLLIGEKYRLPVAVYPYDAENKSLKYTSSDNTIATVTQDGDILGISKGICEIKVTSLSDPLKTTSCSITVVGDYNDKLINFIKIENPSFDIIKEGRLQIKYKIIPTDATDQELVWSSSNNNVASVSENGLITGIENGTCKIRAYNKASNVEAIIDINVVSDYNGSNIDSVSVVGGYTKKCLPYNVFTQDFNVVPATSADEFNPVSITSDFESVADVNGNTIVCQNTNGFTVIRTKFKKEEKDMYTHLHLFLSNNNIQLKNFKVIPEKITVLEGETKKLKFDYEPYDFPFDVSALVYEIYKNNDSDSDIVTIENGNLTGLKKGNVLVDIIYDVIDNDPIKTTVYIEVIDKTTKYYDTDNIKIEGNIVTLYNNEYCEKYLLYSEPPVDTKNYMVLDDGGIPKYLKLTDNYNASLFLLGDSKKAPTSDFRVNLIPRYNFRYDDIRNINFRNNYITKDLIDTAAVELARINKNFKLIEDPNSKNIIEEDNYDDTWNGLTDCTINKNGFVEKFVMSINRLNQIIDKNQVEILKNVTLHEFLHVLGFDDLNDEDQIELNANTIMSYYRNKLDCNMLQPTEIYTLLDMYNLEFDITDLNLGSGYKISDTRVIGGDNDLMRIQSFSYNAIPENLLKENADMIIVGFVDKIETKKINIGGSKVMDYNVVTFLVSEIEKGIVGDIIEVKFPINKFNIEIGENYLLYLKEYKNTPASPLNLTNAIKKL